MAAATPIDAPRYAGDICVDELVQSVRDHIVQLQQTDEEAFVVDRPYRTRYTQLAFAFSAVLHSNPWACAVNEDGYRLWLRRQQRLLRHALRKLTPLDMLRDWKRFIPKRLGIMQDVPIGVHAQYPDSTIFLVGDWTFALPLVAKRAVNLFHGYAFVPMNKLANDFEFSVRRWMQQTILAQFEQQHRIGSVWYNLDFMHLRNAINRTKTERERFQLLFRCVTPLCRQPIVIAAAKHNVPVKPPPCIDQLLEQLTGRPPKSLENKERVAFTSFYRKFAATHAELDQTVFRYVKPAIATSASKQHEMKEIIKWAWNHPGAGVSKCANMCAMCPWTGSARTRSSVDKYLVRQQVNANIEDIEELYAMVEEKKFAFPTTICKKLKSMIYPGSLSLADWKWRPTDFYSDAVLPSSPTQRVVETTDSSAWNNASSALVAFVSEDLSMKCGLSAVFANRFGQISYLRSQHAAVGGICMLTHSRHRFIYYAVTKRKENWFSKLEDLCACALKIAQHCATNKVSRITFPCSLDSYASGRVRDVIVKAFEHVPIEIILSK